MSRIKLFMWGLTLVVLLCVSLSLYKSVSVRRALPPQEFGEIFFLNEVEVKALKERALRDNDPVSAMLLTRYYGSYVKDPIEARKWANMVLKSEGKQPLGESKSE